MSERTCRNCRFCKDNGFPGWYDHQCTVLVATGGEPMPILRHQMDDPKHCERWTEKLTPNQ